MLRPFDIEEPGLIDRDANARVSEGLDLSHKCFLRLQICENYFWAARIRKTMTRSELKSQEFSRYILPGCLANSC